MMLIQSKRRHSQKNCKICSRNICNQKNKLNDKYVFVALNWAGTHGVQEDKPWKNFHSSYPYQNDFKLRYALMDTPFWGSYITDIIKEFPELSSKKVVSHFNNNPNEIKKHINLSAVQPYGGFFCI